MMCSPRISTRVRMRVWVALLAASLWFGSSLPAGAAWKSTPAPPELSVSTATLDAPENLSALNGECVVGISINVDLSWSATASAFAEGYEILRSETSGGPYSKVGTVTGVNSTTFIDTTAEFLTTYYYVVRATKNKWRSINSVESSVTTLASLCS